MNSPSSDRTPISGPRPAGPPLNRRALIRAVTAAGALVSWPALLGCATPSPARTAPAWSQSPTPLVMIMRHAEKPPKSSGSGGIDLRGRADSHSLTSQGWTRAAYLPDLFTPSDGEHSSWGDGRHGPARLPTPRTIYASGPGKGDGEGTRCRETVGPLAASLGLRVNTTFSRGQEADLAQQAAAAPGPVLICWQHGEIPTIAGAFSPVAPKSWPDEIYDRVWLLAHTSGGWRFGEVPQRLLSGDRS